MTHLLQKGVQKVWNVCSERSYVSYWVGHPGALGEKFFSHQKILLHKSNIACFS